MDIALIMKALAILLAEEPRAESAAATTARSELRKALIRRADEIEEMNHRMRREETRL